MDFSNDYGEFQIADERLPIVTTETIAESYGDSPDDFVREESFVTGVSSHSRVADVDPGEDKGLKIGAPPHVPGKKVAVVDGNQNKKIAVPSNLSKWGDFRRTIQVSAEDPEERARCGVKLYGSSMNPLNQRAPRTRPTPR